MKNSIRQIALVGFGAVLAIGLSAGLGETAKAGGSDRGSHGSYGHNSWGGYGNRSYGHNSNYGYNSNYGKRKKAAWVYLTATLDAATWGAELALGEAPGRIYIVQPTGPIEDDPNLTDKKFPGNPTKSYRSRDPLRVTGEVTEWQGHSAEQLQAMKDGVERARQLGIEAIEE